MIRKFIQMLEKLASRSSFAIRKYCEPYETIVDKEIDLGSVKDEDVVLNVGCGSIPFTAIWLARKTNCDVIAIDTDKTAVRNAKRVIRKLGLQENVTIMHRSGTDTSDLAFDKALCALQVQPLGKTLDALNEKASVLIVRRPFDSYATHYDVLPVNYRIKRSVPQKMKAFGSSDLVEKL